MRECNKAAEQSLRMVVLPKVLCGQYNSVGKPAVPSRYGAISDAGLLPVSVDTFRKVRMFTRRSVKDTYWREHVGWMRDSSLEAVDAAFAVVQPYGSHHEIRNEAYGEKAKDSADQSVKYVPKQFGPDCSSLPVGCRAGVLTQTRLTAPSSAPTTALSMQGIGKNGGSGATPQQQPKKVRWSAGVYVEPLARALLALPLNRM